MGFRNDKPRLERTINGTCPRPHHKYALAQCRIGFQPVSPNHGTNHRESDLSPYVLQTIYRSKRTTLPREGMKGSSCGPGDRLEAYPTLLSGASSDDPRLSWRLLPTLSTSNCRQMSKLQSMASPLTLRRAAARRKQAGTACLQQVKRAALRTFPNVER